MKEPTDLPPALHICFLFMPLIKGSNRLSEVHLFEPYHSCSQANHSNMTIQSKQINYMNKPVRFETGIRPPTNTKVKEELLSIPEHDQTLIDHDGPEEEYTETLAEYSESLDQADQKYQYDYAYLKFLE